MKNNFNLEYLSKIILSDKNEFDGMSSREIRNKLFVLDNNTKNETNFKFPDADKIYFPDAEMVHS